MTGQRKPLVRRYIYQFKELYRGLTLLFLGVILIPTLEGGFSLSCGFYSPPVRRTTHKLHNFQLSLSTAQLHPNSGGTEIAKVPTLLGKALLCCSHGNTAAEPGLTPFNGLGEDILQPANQYQP